MTVLEEETAADALSDVRFCWCGEFTEGEYEIFGINDWSANHRFDGMPCYFEPCTENDPCRHLSHDHLKLFGECWVMTSVLHTGGPG